eukprot:COSAG01_NODE_1885_length_8988_cov_2.861514_2_plen_127_part_00
MLRCLLVREARISQWPPPCSAAADITSTTAALSLGYLAAAGRGEGRPVVSSSARAGGGSRRPPAGMGGGGEAGEARAVFRQMTTFEGGTRSTCRRPVLRKKNDLSIRPDHCEQAIFLPLPSQPFPH